MTTLSLARLSLATLSLATVEHAGSGVVGKEPGIPDGGPPPGTGGQQRRPRSGVRRVPPPVVAPPYDDERTEAASTGEPARYGWPLRSVPQPWLPDQPDVLDLPGPAAPSGAPGRTRPMALQGALPLPAPSTAVPRLRLASSPDAAAAETSAPPAAWSARFVRVLLEALAGLRPVSQLAAWANADVCRGLARRFGAAEECRDLRRSTGNLRSLHVSTPATGVAEVCAVVQIGERIRAVALRVEATDRSWRCTDLTIG